MDRVGEYQTVSPEVLDLGTSVNFESISEQKELYKEHLLRLYEKIVFHAPDTLYFLDRSARPVYWMLKSLADSLGRKLPDVKFMSLKRSGSLDENAIETIIQSGNVQSTESICVIDEYESMGFNKRKVDELATRLKLKKVEYIPFMNSKLDQRSPVFYDIPPGLKEYLYGILDSTKESFVSQKSTISRSERTKHRQQYRAIFSDIGRETAVQYRKNHPDLFSS